MKKTIKTNKVNAITLVLGGIVTLLTGFCYLVGLSLVIPLVVALAAYQLSFIKNFTLNLYLKLGLLIAILMAGAHAVITYTHWPVEFVPVASVPMLVMLLFASLRITFLMAFTSSIVTALVVGGGLEFFVITFIGSMVGSYMIHDARARGQVISAGFSVGVIQVITAFLILMSFSKYHLINVYQPLMISGILAAGVVMVSLKVFEMAFGEITNFSLLELSDSLNQPLLKRMAIEAPGTYHHSLMVANLGEAAVDAIGGNALLARVGAYYHDIGKMIKPEYFTENQMMMGNKHDELEPSMSRLVILNHVKEGVELARKHKLNPKLIDFITQHHGTSLVHYFYRKALEEAESNIDETEYRYPGPKPQFKETAVILLADSVEGATRSLDEHSPKKIDETVRKIINNKFIDGQLDECELSLKDLEVIGSSFTRVLSASYHGRVKYQEQQKANADQHNNKQSDNKTDKPSTDQGNSAPSA